MKIGIIDTGVDKSHKRLRNCKIEGVHLHEGNNGDIVLDTDYADENGHGTGIAAIIHQHLPEARLFVVKVSSCEGAISEKLLCTALEYFVQNDLAEVLNVSMGIYTDYPSDRLRLVCKELKQKNILLCASAYYEAEKKCFPAHFPTVFGVGTGLVPDAKSFRFLSGKPTNVLAKGGFQRLATLNNGFKFGSGTSIATAHFSGLLAKMISDGNVTATTETVENWLRQVSDETIISITRHDRASTHVNARGGADEDTLMRELLMAGRCADGLGRLAIFPYEEKEFASALNFADQLAFPVTLALNNARPLKVASPQSALLEKLNIPTSNRPLRDEEMELFDTLVVGYFMDQLLDQNLYHGYLIIRRALEHNKHILLWDAGTYNVVRQIIKQQYPDYTGRLTCPIIGVNMMRKLYGLSSLPRLHTPVVAVVGTGSQQGKFTTQFTLKHILEKAGYRIATVSSEPQGTLFGAELTFPYGHKPTVNIGLQEWSRMVYTYLQVIEKVCRPELILASSQGGIIPLHPADFRGQAVFKQFPFLSGIYPDAVLVTISPGDTVDFIERSVTVLRSFIGCKVLAYCMTPYIIDDFASETPRTRRLPNEDYQRLMRIRAGQLGRPVIDVTDVGNEATILHLIHEAFTNQSTHV